MAKKEKQIIHSQTQITFFNPNPPKNQSFQKPSPHKIQNIKQI